MRKTIFVLYFLLLLLFTIFSYTFIDPNLFYLKELYSAFSFQNRFFTAAIYSLFVILFFVFYFIFLESMRKKLLSIGRLKFLIGITIGILFFSYPAMLSYDIFNYGATAKVLFFYHENPYLVMPIEFISDPLLLFIHAANKIALYGPTWIILTFVPYLLSFGNFILTLFSLKLFIALFYITTIYLIWRISHNAFSVVLFGLNPLVIIETLVSSHNDIVMMFLALFSFFLLIKNKVFLATLFLISSILIKYATLFLVPLFVYGAWKIFKKQNIDWENIWYFSAWVMFIAFLLSPIREEIYPWYALWFLPFLALIPRVKILHVLSIALSFGLLLRYIPFMYLGTHAGPTPILKTLLTFIPTVFCLGGFIIQKRLFK